MTDTGPRWLCSGVEALALRTPTLPPATHTNAYLVGKGELVLVEPASPYPGELLRAKAWVEGRLREGASLVALLLTHHHADHTGGALSLAEHFDVPIWAHALTRQRLVGSVRVDRDLEDGEVLALAGEPGFELQVLHTPGHAPGHLCFLERSSGFMLAGDMVAEVGTILVEPTDGDMALYLDSLARMAQQAPRALLPAHGAPLRDPQATLAYYVRHRLEREAKVLRAVRHFGGAARARDLLPLCYADAPRAAWPLAERSTEAHLIKLAVEGLVRREQDGWISADRGV